MIQRIQTLYLLVAIALNAFVFSLNLALFNYQELSNVYDIFGLIDRESGSYIFSTWMTPALSISSILISIVAILLFKKRSLQIKMAQLALFFQTALVASIFYFVDKAASELSKNPDFVVELNYESGSWVAIVPLIFIFLAIRAIKKDERLIRAADRLR